MAAQVISLRCANCGANLEVTPDLEVFACAYCGSQQRAVRSGGTIALKRLEKAIAALQRSTDRTAAELAVARLDREISLLIARGAEQERAMARALGQTGSLGLGAVIFGAIFESVSLMVGLAVGVLLLMGFVVLSYMRDESQRKRQIDHLRKQIEKKKAVVEDATVT